MKLQIKAEELANRLAKKHSKEFFVVYKDDYMDGPYHVCTQYDLDTFYIGTNPVYSTDDNFYEIIAD